MQFTWKVSSVDEMGTRAGIHGDLKRIPGEARSKAADVTLHNSCNAPSIPDCLDKMENLSKNRTQ